MTCMIFAYILSVTTTCTLEWKIYEIHIIEKNKTNFKPIILFHKSYFSAFNKSWYTKIWVLVSILSLCCPTHFSHYFTCFFMSYTEMFSIGHEEVQKTV